MAQPKSDHFANIHNLELVQEVNDPLLLEGKEHSVVPLDHHMVIHLGYGK